MPSSAGECHSPTPDGIPHPAFLATFIGVIPHYALLSITLVSVLAAVSDLLAL